jgi:hypothetical protein
MRFPVKAFLTLAGGLLLIAVPGQADTIIIHDVTEGTLSVTQIGSRDALTSSCTAESCDILVQSNDHFNDSQRVPPPLAIAEAGGVNISDEITTRFESGLSTY